MKKHINRFLLFIIFTCVFYTGLVNHVFALQNDYLDYTVAGNECIITNCDKDASGEIIVPEKAGGRTVTAIADSAFSGCDKITGVVLPDTVKSIGKSAFANCSSLTFFSIPDSVTALGNAAFYRCVKLNKIKLSAQLSIVPSESFYGCEKLSAVEIPDKVYLYGEKAFYGCRSLERFIFGEKTTTIGNSCFADCSSLLNIYLPGSLVQIGSDAFEKCTALSDVYYQKSESVFKEIEVFQGNTALLRADMFFNHVHSLYSEKNVVEAGCLTGGYTESFCICGYFSKEDYTEALGHSLSDFVTVKNPDCQNKGLAKIYCVRCDYCEEMILDKSSHRIAVDEAVAATCFESGKTQGSHCYQCLQVLTPQQEIPALGHYYNEKIIDNDHLVSKATYLKPAVYRYSCIRCSAVGDKTYTTQKLVLGKPDKFVSTSTVESITLGWTKVRDADGYGIYYKNAQGKWKFYRKTTENIYKISRLPSGTVYTFAVRAYVVEDGLTVGSPVYVTLKEATRPSAPSKITAKQNDSAIQISWSASDGATGYRVYGYNTKTKSWVVVCSETSALKYTIKNLKSGTYYKFAVRPYVNTGYKIVWCDGYKDIVTATKPASPSLKATSLKGGVRFQWDRVSGADGYIIYGSTKPDSGYVRLCVTTGQTYTKSGLESGKTYYFRAYSIKRLGDDYVYSYLSDIKPVKTK